MDEHEKRKVGQEVKEVQGWNVLQLPQDSGLLLQTDPTGLQLQQKLFWADEALMTGGISALLIQEKQEQLLRESGEKKKKKERCQADSEAACVALHSCVFLGAPVGSFRLPQPLSRRLSAPVCTVNAVEVIIVGAEGGGEGEGDNPSGNQHLPPPPPQASPVNNPIPNSSVITKPPLPGQRLSFHTPGHRLSCCSAFPV